MDSDTNTDQEIPGADAPSEPPKRMKKTHTLIVFFVTLTLFLVAFYLIPLDPSPVNTKENWIEQVIDVRIILAALHVALFGGVLFLITSIAVAVFENKPLVSFLGGLQVADDLLEKISAIKEVSEQKVFEAIMRDAGLRRALEREQERRRQERATYLAILRDTRRVLEEEQRARHEAEALLEQGDVGSSGQ